MKMLEDNAYHWNSKFILCNNSKLSFNCVIETLNGGNSVENDKNYV